MKLLSKIAIYHKHNDDDTWNLIFMKCFLAVTTAPIKENLEASEQRHDCAKLFATKTSQQHEHQTPAGSD